MLKIGLSINETKINDEFFRECAEAGINCIELSPTPEGNTTLDVKEAASLIRACGLEVWSYHLPFLPFEELDISAPTLAKKSVEYLSSLIKRAADAGIRNFVIHSSGEPISDDERSVRMKTAKESLAVLAELASQYGGHLLVENLPRTVLGKNSGEMLELLSAHPSLRAVFDTNHLLCEDAVEFIKALGDKIVSTHVSDYDKIDEKHWLPGEGSADFVGIYKSLLEVGYNGPWLYELSLTNTVKITRKRDLTPLDIANNARELFDGKTFTVIE